MTATYAEIRDRNIAANRQLLLSLKLSAPVSFKPPNPVARPKPRSPKPKKRKRLSTVSDVDKDLGQSPDAAPLEGLGGRRRSLRIQSRPLPGAKRLKSESGSESEFESESDEADSGSDSDQDAPQPRSAWRPPLEPRRPKGAKLKPRSLKGSRPDPKIFGHQVGSEVGDWWDSRMSCSQAGVHAPPVSGIAGSEIEGCYSVALSGGYEDDVDLGYAFTYTGSGGRALSGTANNPKNLRTAPQTSDQTFTAMNASLKVSCEKRNPIRVIRGYKNESPFAPVEGYRYDGLYRVEKCWRESGASGFQVCKFAFVRLPGQPKIPVQEGRESEAKVIYGEMGFDVEQLPASPAKGQCWSQKLARSRILAAKSAAASDRADEGEPDDENKPITPESAT